MMISMARQDDDHHTNYEDSASNAYLGHLLNHHNILLISLDPGERVQICLHGADFLL